MQVGSIAQLLTVLLIFLLVLFLAWYSARLVAKYQKGGTSSKGNIEVVDAFRLSQTQVVEILRVGDRYIAVALGKDAVSKLGEWKQDEIALDLADKQAGEGGGSFRRLLDQIGKRKNGDGEDNSSNDNG